MEFFRWVTLLILILFSAYTLYCIKTENFWKSVKAILSFRWGKQVAIDLYIGLFLFLFLVYLNEGSLLAATLWIVPTLVLGNIIPLAYFVLNFNSILQNFN